VLILEGVVFARMAFQNLKIKSKLQMTKKKGFKQINA